MDLEFAALVSNETWILVPRTFGMHIGNKWVFQVKYNPDSTIQRYKTRLVAKGLSQTLRIDFSETFSLVVKLATIQLVLTLALSKEWPIKQLDFNNAF